MNENKESTLELIHSLIEKNNITHRDLYPDQAEDVRFLDALRKAGVDNWEWYEEALGAICDEEDDY